MILRSVCSIGYWIASAGSFIFSLFATPTTPQGWLQYHHRIRDLGTWAVIIGVVAEIVIDEFWEIEKPALLRGIKATTLLKTRADRLKRCAMICAGVVMVGGGIGVEMWQGGRADYVSDQIRTNLQTQLVRVTRLLGPRQVDPFASLKALVKFAKTPLSIEIPSLLSANIYNQADVSEELMLATQLCGAAQKAGWSVSCKAKDFQSKYWTPPLPIGPGVTIVTYGPDIIAGQPPQLPSDADKAAEALEKFLCNEDVPAMLTNTSLQLPKDSVLVVIGANRTSADFNLIGWLEESCDAHE